MCEMLFKVFIRNLYGMMQNFMEAKALKLKISVRTRTQNQLYFVHKFLFFFIDLVFRDVLLVDKSKVRNLKLR